MSLHAVVRGAGARHAAGILVSAALFAVYARVPAAWALGTIALVPWMLALDRGRRLRGALVSGLAMALAFVAAVFGWFGAAIAAYVGVDTVGATAALLALAPLLQPQFVVWALVRRLAARRFARTATALLAAAAWVGCESLWPKLFGDTLGHGLHGAAWWRQAADLGGATGLTVVLLLANEAIGSALARRRAGVRAWSPPLAACAALLATVAAYGAVRLASLQAAAAPEGAPLRVAMVQASITDYERLRREMGAYAVVRHVLDTHYALSWSALRDHDADVLLWSETVYPTTFGQPRSEVGAELDAELAAFVDAAGVPLVFGAYDVDGAGEYNAAMFVEPGRGLVGAYRKTHPFPLTEHVPAWLDGPRLRAWLPWTGHWQPGHGARVMPLRTRDGRSVDVVPLICLDDVHPQLAIDGARLGAQAIVGLSNDAWFTAHPLGARLHLTVAAFRSVETRLPQVRVTTNGLSAVIDDTGAIRARTAMGDQAVLTAFVHAQAPPPTLMVRWGDWVGRAALVLLSGVVVFLVLDRRRRRAAGPPPAGLPARAVHLTPATRAVTATLRVCAAAVLAWLALDMLRRTGLRVTSLAQLQLFAAGVLAPLLAAAAIARRGAVRVAVENGQLVLARGRMRSASPVAAVAALRPWRLPWPGDGVDLAPAPGHPGRVGLAGIAPRTLAEGLRAAGTAAPVVPAPDTGLGAFLAARAERRPGRLDHAGLKFGLFALLPALVAFRLHQVIAYGGTFGEWRTFGPAAWSGGLLLWWLSWMLGLMLLAAALRVVVEAACLGAALCRPPAATPVRAALETAARGAYYLGVPVWLGWRLLGGG